MNPPWPHRLSPAVQRYIDELPAERAEFVRATVRDILAIAGRNPWGWPQWDTTDPEGQDIRTASVGSITLVYTINRMQRHLYAITVVHIEA